MYKVLSLIVSSFILGGLLLNLAVPVQLTASQSHANPSQPESAIQARSGSLTIHADQEYTITDLGAVYPFAINNQRQVVGIYTALQSTCYSFLWEENVLHCLSDPAGTAFASAVDINEQSQVVGLIGYLLDSYLWSDANANHTIDVDELEILQPLGGHNIASVRAISDLELSVGASGIAGSDPAVQNAASWSGGSVNNLGGSHAYDVNNAGVIVGYDNSNGNSIGVRWVNGVKSPVTPDGKFMPFAINNQGEITGYIQEPGENAIQHLWLPEPAYGLPAGLHNLGFVFQNGRFSYGALDINDRGQVIGGGKYLWQEGVLTDVNTLLPANSGWNIVNVESINERGDIVGEGYFNGLLRGFLLAAPDTNWTLLFYLDGDNNLAASYPAIFQHLEANANLPGVRLLALWDSSGNGDSDYYEIAYDSNLSQYADYTEGENMWSQGELNMGAPFTLSDFIQWGVQRSPSQHYALILDDHGSGLGGLAWDDTDNQDFITLAELKLALNTAFDQTRRKMDVLYMAMCLMGMLEDAYQVRGLADYYVASQDIQTTYSQYLVGFDGQMDPAQAATALAAAYAAEMTSRNKEYTISVADLAQLNPLVAAANSFGQALAARMDVISPTLATVTGLVQRYDNQPPSDVLDAADTYIDLYDFASLVSQNLGAEADIVTQAEAVRQAIQNFVLYEGHASQPTYNVDNSHGVSIFYPATASSFYHAENYDFAVGAAWDVPRTSLAAAADATTWAGFLVDYFEFTQPGGPDDPNPPALIAKKSTLYTGYLPILFAP